MSYQRLEKNLGFDKLLPVSENWSAAADFLQLISDYCLENKPQTVVECSSGTSSLVLSQCCRLNGSGHVFSLENGQEFAENTEQQLDEFFLSSYCDVIFAPLKMTVQDGEEYQWYDLENFPCTDIDLLIIDGPPGFIQKHSRYPALPLLFDRLAKHCAVFLDDAAREDEQEIVRRWLRAYPEFKAEYIANERGCYFLAK